MAGSTEDSPASQTPTGCPRVPDSAGVVQDQALLRIAVEWAGHGRRFALAMVLRTEGSTPRSAGTRALIDEEGRILGTIGGGAVEAQAQRDAPMVIRDGWPKVLDFALEGRHAEDRQPICGGNMRVLVFVPDAAAIAALSAAVAALDGRQRGVLLTSVQGSGPPTVAVRFVAEAQSLLTSAATVQGLSAPGSHPLHEPPPLPACGHPLPRPKRGRGQGEGVAPGSWSQCAPILGLEASRFMAGEQARKEQGAPHSPPSGLREASCDALRCEKPELVEDASVGSMLLVEPIIPPPRLLVVGGGHVGQAVAHHAALVGFSVTVLDDRPEFTEPRLFQPGVNTHCGDMAEEVRRFDFRPDLYVVIVTRGHRHDGSVLERCLRRPAAYVGMIGSARKVALLRREFIASGTATAEEFNRVYAPIGLDIGAVTVPEIAVSVVAQLIAVRRQGSAGRLPSGAGL